MNVLRPILILISLSFPAGALAPNDTTDASVTEYFLEGTEPTTRGLSQRLLQRLQPFLLRPRF